ncbi:Fic family protein [uncultured Acidaminococcus sp.]|uniref:Fic family protein n=1 Tax=uncultured Acidaminococcus sp. TaxID=352152 RepID=UPI0026194025|nr:Fic family protein [uncultured Acidaminococcus sp.]
MDYRSVKDTAAKWKISERAVRKYCSEGRVPGAFLTGKTWNVPENAEKPLRRKRKDARPATLLDILREEKKGRVSGGLYHRLQIDMTYNSNHIEGSRLTHEQTRYIYETRTIAPENEPIRLDDVMETVNHFRCIDEVIDHADHQLSEAYILKLHQILKMNTTDAQKEWFAVGTWKKLPNEVGGQPTAAPEKVPAAIKNLLAAYNKNSQKTLDEILDFHVQFERIHPFQDGNGRVGRLIMLGECLRNNIVPFIITEELKFYYYRGLAEWDKEPGYLRDTCLTAQDYFKKVLKFFQRE